jgi:hypothetical protein
MYVCMSLSCRDNDARICLPPIFFVCSDPSFTTSETGIRGIFGDDCKN